MKKAILITLALATSSFSIEVETLETKLDELRSLHALECAPAEFGRAETYVEVLKGIKIKENDKEELVFPTEIDKLIYENKVKIYIAKAKEKIFSDIDNDDIPCDEEIERGTNPYVSDKKYVKISKKEEKKEIPKVEKKIAKVEKKERKKEFEPLKTQARIHFEFNSTKIKKEYLPYLNVISRYLKTHKNLKVKIIGYTDNIGSKDYNDNLALGRAKAVKEYLVKMGVDSNRIEILGKGKENYLFDNDTDLNRFTNRRAEFFVMETK